MLLLSASSVPGDPGTKNRKKISLCHLFLLSFLMVCCRAALPESSSNNSDSVVSGDGEGANGYPPTPLGSSETSPGSSSGEGLFSGSCHGCAATENDHQFLVSPRRGVSSNSSIPEPDTINVDNATNSIPEPDTIHA